MINQYMRRIFEEVDFGNIYIFGKASNLLEEMIGGLGELDLRPSRLGARRSCKVNDLADGNYGYMPFNFIKK